MFDIIGRSVIFVVGIIVIFYVVPMIMIPDVIQMFKETFKRSEKPKIDFLTCYKNKKKLWDQSTIDIKI